VSSALAFLAKLGHVGEAHKYGLFAAPELGDLAIDEVGREFEVEPADGRIAVHGFNLTGEPHRPLCVKISEGRLQVDRPRQSKTRYAWC
jgi:hypothetical protein